MSTQRIVTLIDDIDGSEATETVRFEYDRIRYEIDLSADNARKLRTHIRPYADAQSRAAGTADGAPARPALKAPARHRAPRGTNGASRS